MNKNWAQTLQSGFSIGEEDSEETKNVHMGKKELFFLIPEPFFRSCQKNHRTLDPETDITHLP